MATNNARISEAYTLTSIASMHDFAFPDQVKNKLYNRYGKGFTLVQMFRNMGREFEMKNDYISAHELGSVLRTITTNGASGGGAGAGTEVTITLSGDDIDATGGYYPRVGFTVYHLHTDNLVYGLQITAISTDSPPILTLKPFDTTLNTGNGGIATGTELAIGGSAFAAGTGQPEPTSTGLYERDFYTTIAKESMGFDGPELAKERWEEKQVGGKNRIWSRAYAETEFLLDAAEDCNFLMGEENSNSIAQTTVRNYLLQANTAVLRSGKGIWKWQDEIAGTLNYGTGDFNLFDLDQIPVYQRSQGVTDGVAILAVGQGLALKLENSGLEFVKEYSGGTDFTRVVQRAFGGAEQRALDIGFKMFTKGGITYVMKVVDTFSNPKLFGVSTYNLDDSGFTFPVSSVKDKKSGLTIPNVSIGNFSHNGVNRKRVIGVVNGMSGFSDYPIVSGNDTIDMFMLSQRAIVAMGVNQHVQLKPLDA